VGVLLGSERVHKLSEADEGSQATDVSGPAGCLPGFAGQWIDFDEAIGSGFTPRPCPDCGRCEAFCVARN
jgi:hypothetical protein